MKKLFLNVLRGFMYFCFIVSAISIIAVLFTGVASLKNNESYATRSGDTFLILMGIFILSILIGLLSRYLFNRFDY
jgi:hypothetical protein